MPALRYRLALDLGSTSLGWAMIRLNAENQPCAVIKAGVRIFSDGRNPKDGSSLAVTRRDARSMRRRRDRLLKRKDRMVRSLIEHGFFPADDAQRKTLVTLNPYTLRAKGLDAALAAEEFARALFHINQRRGFKSNRKTDKKDNDSGALKQAILGLRTQLDPQGADGKARTVGELLLRRFTNIALAPEQRTVRARYREPKVTRDDGKTKINKSYDLYIDRAMISDEFDALWRKQAELNPALFTEAARADLKDVLLHQRPLKPVKPGRCTFMPEEERAPLALPSTQRFRMYQEINNLRILRAGLQEEALTLQQRDDLIKALEANSKRTFTQIKTLLKTGGAAQFNFEDPKRQELKGNVTSAILSRAEHFGAAWFTFSEAQQDAIVLQLVKEENEAKLIRWLQDQTGIDENRAETIANAGLPEGYGSLCAIALARILPELRRDVVTYDKAVLAAGFDHHSHLGQNTEVPDLTHASEQINPETGEIKTFHVFNKLPYYGEYMQRHVGFGTGKLEDSDEKRYGKIANPTVHIGLNQIRLVVNALIKRYGHPNEVIVELARDLKQSKDQREDESKRQAENQRRNIRLRGDVAGTLGIAPERVRIADIQKMILWEELSSNIADRRCPYSGVQISAAMLLSDQVEIEHILPFSETLDDSLNNKTVALRQANRVKGNRTPWAAFGVQPAAGFVYADMLARAEQMPKAKRYRFGEEAMKQWLKDDAGFLARALNDTRHMSKVAREYMSLVCPQNTRVIPGRMTAILRAKFGLNDVLGVDGLKNRNDHRHHAVDACVIAVTDQGLLQRFAAASASAREQQLNRLVENMTMPWGTDQDRKYYYSVKRAIDNICVSHKPDHGHEGKMFDATIYSALGKSRSAAKDRNVIPFAARTTSEWLVRRHGEADGKPKPYKGLLSNSNYCIELFRTDSGSWDGVVLRTYDAYQIVRQCRNAADGIKKLRNSRNCSNGHPLTMRLMINDYIRVKLDGQAHLLQVLKINSSGSITFIKPNETNISAKYTAKLAAQKAQRDGQPHDIGALNDDFFQRAFSAQSLKAIEARHVTISPIGELNDPGFRE